MNNKRKIGRALSCRDTERAYFFRQAWLGLRNTVLHQLLGLIGICAECESDGQGHDTISGRLALHIEHTFDTVDLLFKRCCDSF